jgi:hypothetical protein
MLDDVGVRAAPRDNQLPLTRKRLFLNLKQRFQLAQFNFSVPRYRVHLSSQHIELAAARRVKRVTLKSGDIMKTTAVGALILASLAAVSTSVFASGYGPASHYDPNVGAPSSQRGQSAQTLAAENNTATSNSAGHLVAVNAAHKSATNAAVSLVPTSVAEK